MNLRGNLVYAEYHDDFGDIYTIRLTESIANAGGFNHSTIRNPANPPWENLRKQMRHIMIKTPDNLHHDRIPIASPNFNPYVYGGTIDDVAGRDGWVVTGRKGESETF